MSPPTVSVIIPTYNRRSLLPRALDSVIAQTFSDWEIVLVDDGSTDGTEMTAAGYADRLGDRFVYIRQQNRGSSSARNTGIESCRGRFVAFLDSDDEFLPTKLQRQLALFHLRPELGFVYSDFAFIDLDGIRHESVFDAQCPLARQVPFETVGAGLCVCTGSLFDSLIQGYFIATIVGMVRRDVLGNRIRFPEDQAYAEEWLFYLHVARACRAGFVDEPLCLHHHVRGSLARTDKHRNTVHYRALLEAIQSRFDDLSRAHRAAVRTKLARTHRQLGYDALRADHRCEALSHFAQSLRYRPGPPALREVAGAAAGLLWPRRRRLGTSGVTQELPEVVR